LLNSEDLHGLQEKSGCSQEKMIDKIRPAVNDPAKEIERLVGNALKGEFYRSH
jgi:hypothetical protein